MKLSTKIFKLVKSFEGSDKLTWDNQKSIEVKIQELINNRVEDYILEGIQTDGSHHKQWTLYEVAKQLGIKVPDDVEGEDPIEP